MSFTEQIKPYMDAKSIRPTALARMTGYSVPYMFGLLSGDRRWNESSMNKTCDALGLEMKIIEKGEAYEKES